jgi:iron complex transport system substrate-binding protein
MVSDPDYILVNAGTGMINATDNTDPVYQYFLTDPRLSQLKAVRENHIVLVDTDTISRGGPRIVDAIEQVARSIHPECYSQDTATPAARQDTPQQQTPGFTAFATFLSCLSCLVMYMRGMIK